MKNQTTLVIGDGIIYEHTDSLTDFYLRLEDEKLSLLRLVGVAQGDAHLKAREDLAKVIRLQNELIDALSSHELSSILKGLSQLSLEKTGQYSEIFDKIKISMRNKD